MSQAFEHAGLKQKGEPSFLWRWDEDGWGHAMSCQDAWARELGDLVRRTMIAADKLDDSAMSTEQAETENTLAAQALQGLL